MESIESITFSFSDFPEDVQLCILSFLDQSDIATFACTSKRFVSLCRDDPRLWFSMCDRRWGSKTLIKKWGNGKISFKHLYKTLLEYENLIGFWRRCGGTSVGTAALPPSQLIFFEWGPIYIMGSRVSPSRTGTYEVIKSPFLWISLTSKGESINYLDPEGKLEMSENIVDSGELGILENELIPVNVSFMGKCHFVLEEILNLFGNNSNSSSNERFIKVPSSGNVRGEEYEDVSGSPGSFPDRLMSEIYQHFANRTSPGGNGSSRRQRRREKEKQGRRKMEPEHFVKIINCSPTPARPLQGLWKETREKIWNLAEAPIEAFFTDSTYGKFEHGEALDRITQDVKKVLEEESDEEGLKVLSKTVDTVRKEVVRRRIISEGLRVDERHLDEVRPLYCEAGNLPALHGSSLFSRGDTQVLCTVTLGAPAEAQRLDSIVGPPTKCFMLHYSFPPCCINEVGKRGGLNRREVGHGTLAEKALLAVLPPEKDFPYTVRINSEIMVSDGSTSMATVCGGSMALMDAGIPLREHVAGGSVGLVSEIDSATGEIKDYRILTDILGLEDHLCLIETGVEENLEEEKDRGEMEEDVLFLERGENKSMVIYEEPVLVSHMATSNKVDYNSDWVMKMTNELHKVIGIGFEGFENEWGALLTAIEANRNSKFKKSKSKGLRELRSLKSSIKYTGKDIRGVNIRGI